MDDTAAVTEAQGRKAPRETWSPTRAINRIRATVIRVRARRIMRVYRPIHSVRKKERFLLSRHHNEEIWQVPAELVLQGFLDEIVYSDDERIHAKKGHIALEYKFWQDAIVIPVIFALTANQKQKKRFVRGLLGSPDAADVPIEAYRKLEEIGYPFAGVDKERYDKLLGMSALRQRHQDALMRKDRDPQAAFAPPTRKDGEKGRSIRFLFFRADGRRKPKRRARVA